MIEKIDGARNHQGRQLYSRVCKGCGVREQVLKQSADRPCWKCYTANRKLMARAKQQAKTPFHSTCPKCGAVAMVVQKRSVGKRCMSCIKTEHGLSRTRLYKIWNGMMARTSSPASTFYGRYGGRGIKVCEEWGDVHSFIEWATAYGYAPGLQIDRIDNDGDYSPLNCRWVTSAVNCRNRSTSLLSESQVIEIRRHLSEGTATQKQLAAEFGVSRRTISAIKSGANWTAK